MALDTGIHAGMTVLAEVRFIANQEKNGLTFICFDCVSIDSSIGGEAYYQFWAQEISKQALGKKVDVIGFSIGAFIALQTCRYIQRVRA